MLTTEELFDVTKRDINLFDRECTVPVDSMGREKLNTRQLKHKNSMIIKHKDYSEESAKLSANTAGRKQAQSHMQQWGTKDLSCQDLTEFEIKEKKSGLSNKTYGERNKIYADEKKDPIFVNDDDDDDDDDDDNDDDNDDINNSKKRKPCQKGGSKNKKHKKRKAKCHFL
jgi:hypothetical protein